jgi:hypothetical protein
MEQHNKSRRSQCLVTIEGRDTNGRCFKQKALATGISKSGALLSGITRHVRPGDVICVEQQGRRSRFKVVWVRDSESHQLIQVAIHLLASETCPWES